MKIKVRDLPHNFKDYKYITVFDLGKEFLFWQGWNDKAAALEQALEIHGCVVPADIIAE